MPTNQRRTRVRRALTNLTAAACGVAALVAGTGSALAAERGPASVLQDSAPPWLVHVARIEGGRTSYSTGIVVSGDGAVLMSSDFVARGGDVYVLDGGTDPAQHGLKIDVVRESNLQGLIVARADGLSRDPAEFASTVPDAREPIHHLSLADPSEARGTVTAITDSSQAAYTSDGELIVQERNLLPNLTGGVTNECGQLFGISLARGAPTIAGTGTTGYIWLDRLGATLAGVDSVVASQRCEVALQPAAVAATMGEPPRATDGAVGLDAGWQRRATRGRWSRAGCDALDASIRVIGRARRDGRGRNSRCPAKSAGTWHVQWRAHGPVR